MAKKALMDCLWFARCFEPAVGLQKHAVLDQVPICARCAKFVDQPQEFVAGKFVPGRLGGVAFVPGG